MSRNFRIEARLTGNGPVRGKSRNAGPELAGCPLRGDWMRPGQGSEVEKPFWCPVGGKQ